MTNTYKSPMVLYIYNCWLSGMDAGETLDSITNLGLVPLNASLKEVLDSITQLYILKDRDIADLYKRGETNDHQSSR